MLFELTEALINDILFSMEDQKGDFLLDTREGVVTGWAGKNGEIPEAARYVRLPTWGSSDGFRLMERFVAALRNPLIREELSGALNRGKGVFRAFKNTLGQHPGTEKLWFAFKEREMKREILRWYNALREERGLEQIGMEPEETEDLVLEDFRFRRGLPDDEPEAVELRRLCTEESRSFAAEKQTPCLAGERPWVFPGDLSLVAETIEDEFAGYITAVNEDGILHICALAVKPGYRGLGIGEALMTRLLNAVDSSQSAQISIDLPVWAEGFSRVLLRESFHPTLVRYCRDLQQDGRSTN